MADAILLEDDAKNFARLAVQLDTAGRSDGAKFYYMVSPRSYTYDTL